MAMGWLVAVVSCSVGWAFDHTQWQAVLDKHVDAESRVDYAAAKEDVGLEGYVTSLQTASEPKDLADKLAFWMNAYNALTVDLVADEWPVESIRDIENGKPWSRRSFVVAGRTLTLDDIEHSILRPLGDPRVHAGLNCASEGCPPLHNKAYTADNLNKELSAAMARWVKTTGLEIDAEAKVVRITKIVDWYGDDFMVVVGEDIPGVKGKQEAALRFFMRHLTPEQRLFVRAGGYKVEWLPYSWRVNASTKP